MSINFERALALVQAASHHFGMKELAEFLNKAVSTLYAELNQTEGYKLGVRDFFKIILKTGDTAPLKAILGDMGWVLYPIQASGPDSPVTPAKIIFTLALVNKECSTSMGVTLEALEDGKITLEEAIRCSESCVEALDSVSQLKSAFDEVIKLHLSRGN